MSPRASVANPGGIAARVLVTALLACAAASCSKQEDKPPEPRLVNVVRVDPGSGTSEVAYSGDVRAMFVR
jgi:hypothetical protein